MPLFYDVLPYLVENNSMSDMIVAMICSSTNLSREEVLRLDMVDGAAIIGPLGKAIELFTKILASMNKGEE